MPADPSADAARGGYVYIDIEGQRFDFWTDYHVTSDLLSPSDGFAFGAALPKGVTASRLRDSGLVKGQKVGIYVLTPFTNKPTLQMTGRIEDLDVETTRAGAGLVHVAGFDHMYDLTASDMAPTPGLETATLATVFQRTLLPFGFKADDIVLSNETFRSVLTGKPATGASSDAKPLEAIQADKARANAGESVYGFLERHARRFGLLIVGTGDGKIFVGRPNYAQPPSNLLILHGVDAGGQGNNVKSARRHTTNQGLASEIHVYGHGGGSDAFASSVHQAVYDHTVSDAGIYRPVVVHDPKVRTKVEAEQRARWELSKRAQHADAVTMVVDGHADGDAIYAIDTMARVDWDDGDVHDLRYVLRRDFSRSSDRSHGAETALTLVPEGSIALGEMQYLSANPTTKPKKSLKLVIKPLPDGL